MFYYRVYTRVQMFYFLNIGSVFNLLISYLILTAETF